MKMKSIGIITMHRVLNYGSALQAYALQEYLRKVGFRSTLINYKYPNEYHICNKKTVDFTLKQKISIKKSNLINFFFYHTSKQIASFNKFYDQFFHETNEIYNSPEELKSRCPDFDLYISGSDQIWNPNNQNGDTSYLCSFRKKNAPAISFASSFTISELPEFYRNKYEKELSKFTAIGVREQSGVSILQDMGLDGTICCDPTFLLSKEDYEDLADIATIQINRPYILAYILNYAFNPYPKIMDVIDSLRKRTGLPVYFLLMNSIGDFSLLEKRISDAGPLEFLSLIKNAKYVVTSSFHGTALSLILEKNFYAIVPSEKRDGRINTLLEKVGCTNRGISVKQEIWSFEDIDYRIVREKSAHFIEDSKKYLNNAIKKALKYE